jgi:hypothetical protein
LLVGEFELLGQMPCESGLGQSSCHVMFSFLASPWAACVDGLPPRNAYRMEGGATEVARARNPCIHAASKNPADGYNAALGWQSQWQKPDFHNFLGVFFGFCLFLAYFPDF